MREVVNARTGGCDSSVRSSIEEATVIQQGQVFKLKAKGADGEPLWAYRYRLDGRGSARPQVGGLASRAEAQKALAKSSRGSVAVDVGPRSRLASWSMSTSLSIRPSGDDREAALAARQGNRGARREAARRSVAAGRVRVAADDPGGASI
jgi:hypothetical protein